METSADSTKPVPPTLPRTISLAIAAVVAQVVFMAIRTVGIFGYTDQLGRLLVKSNHDAKTPKSPYGPAQVARDLHAWRISGVWQALIVSIALLLLAYSLRKAGTASMTRWALLIVIVMTGGPFSVVPAKGWPVVPQVALVLSGLASIAVIVLLFLPDSRRYFREAAAARKGAMAAAAQPARPGLLNALFRPRPRPAPGAKAGAKAGGGRPSGADLRKQVRMTKDNTAQDTSQPTSKAPKAKGRSDADAIARGAELARSRAKASKSRRTEA
ncbi:MAG: hypothetical protein QOK11_2097 [Pseudonocardiales bacterium]|nr:hypothetical protein [Pseudonocardiales bacterium]